MLSQTAGGDVTSATTTVGVDHNPGTVTITSPATGATIDHKNSVPVTGSTTSVSGVSSVTLKATPLSPSGTTTSTTCTLGTGTFTCAWDTSAIVYGTYELRAQMKQGNTVIVTSAPVSVTVDNVNASVSMSLARPSSSGYVKGTETLTATPISNLAVTSVRYDVSTAGANAWAAVCARPRRRAVLLCLGHAEQGERRVRPAGGDDAGERLDRHLGTTTVTVANLKAVDIRGSTTTNGAGEVGDTLVFTYSTKANPSSIMSGWNGLGAPTVNLSFVNGSPDSVTVVGTNLGQVTLSQDYVKNQNFTITGNMTAADVNGATVVTITLTSAAPSNRTNALNSANVTTWTPSASVTGFYLGGACAVGAVTKTGVLW